MRRKPGRLVSVMAAALLLAGPLAANAVVCLTLDFGGGDVDEFELEVTSTKGDHRSISLVRDIDGEVAGGALVRTAPDTLTASWTTITAIAMVGYRCKLDAASLTGEATRHTIITPSFNGFNYQGSCTVGACPSP